MGIMIFKVRLVLFGAGNGRRARTLKEWACCGRYVGGSRPEHIGQGLILPGRRPQMRLHINIRQDVLESAEELQALESTTTVIMVSWKIGCRNILPYIDTNTEGQLVQSHLVSENMQARDVRNFVAMAQVIIDAVLCESR